MARVCETQHHQPRAVYKYSGHMGLFDFLRGDAERGLPARSNSCGVVSQRLLNGKRESCAPLEVTLTMSIRLLVGVVLQALASFQSFAIGWAACVEGWDTKAKRSTLWTMRVRVRGLKGVTLASES